MEDYKSNSDKARQEQQSEKKVEAVITGAAKTRKKGEMQKFADVFIAEDANNVRISKKRVNGRRPMLNSAKAVRASTFIIFMLVMSASSAECMTIILK